MTKRYESIKPIRLQSETTYFLPVAQSTAIAHIDDPAHDVMLDFSVGKPTIVRDDNKIDKALYEMKTANEHLALVVDKNNYVIGLISTEDMLGEKPLQEARERELTHEHLTVKMVMTPRDEVLTLAMEDLRLAKVGNIITTLAVNKQHYAVVVEKDTLSNHQKIRGLFLASKISRMLGRDVTKDLSEAHSLAELQRDLL